MRLQHQPQNAKAGLGMQPQAEEQFCETQAEKMLDGKHPDAKVQRWPDGLSTAVVTPPINIEGGEFNARSMHANTVMQNTTIATEGEVWSH